MSTMWKTVGQVGLVLLTGGALMLSGGIAAAVPGAAAARSADGPPVARAECAVMQLPGMDMQLGEPGACVSVLLPSSSVGGASQPATAPSTAEPAAPAATPAPAPAPAPVSAVTSAVGALSAPVQQQSLPYPCLDVQLPGVRISIGDASPPTQCFVLPAS